MALVVQLVCIELEMCENKLNIDPQTLFLEY